MGEGFLIGVDVKKREQTLGVVGGRPNVYVTFNAPGSKVLVLQLGKVDDLDNRLSMGQLEDMKLVFLMESVNNKVTAA